MKIVTVEEMRRMEEGAAAAGVSLSQLMENAGLAVALNLKELLGNVEGQEILALIGSGNNGSDGLVAARHLHDWGAKVEVYLCSSRSAEDPNLSNVKERQIPVLSTDGDKDYSNLKASLRSTRVVIDAVLGTGRTRPLQGVIKEILQAVSQEKEGRPELFIVALDIPTGLDPNSGHLDPFSPGADVTLTLGFPKVGLFNFPGAEKIGRLEVLDIGIPDNLSDDISLELMTREWARDNVPRRPSYAHKGTFGRVLIIAGSLNYVGAAYLASMAAARVGAGLVTLAVAQSLVPILASKLAEITYIPLPESETGAIDYRAATVLRPRLSEYDAMLIGCGLGQNPAVGGFVRGLLLSSPLGEMPLVVDADALNVLSQTPQWWQRLPQEAILTPHAGEMGRLAQKPVDEVQAGRLKLARETASHWNKTVVLKGAHTVVASPDGKAMLSPFANPGLATAGTGDVLAGVILGLLAQGSSLFQAASLGVYMHASVGEEAKNELGDAGMLASDLLNRFPGWLKRLKE